jgi:hypothetical protein
LTIPDAVFVPRQVEVGSHSSAPEPLAQPATPVSTDEGDLIRPLTLAPSEDSQPQTDLQTLPPQPSNQASNAVSAGADSSASTVAVATPVIIPLPAPPPDATGGAPQALLGVVSPGVDISGEPTAHAAGSRKVAHGHHGRVHGRTSESSGGIHLGTGHAATGGGSHGQVHHRGSAAGAQPDVSSTSGSGTANSSSFMSGGSLAFAGTNGGAGGTNPSASGTTNGFSGQSVKSSGKATNYTSSHAKWSIAGVGNGTVYIKHSDGVNVIGGLVMYAVNVTGGGSIVPNSVTWTITGPSGEYTNLSPPNPDQGQMSWNSNYYPTYNLAAQNNPSIHFCWGSVPGTESFQAKVTIQVTKNNVVYTTIASPKGTAEVGSPGWTGDFVAQNSASFRKNALLYGHATFNPDTNEVGADPEGIQWNTLDPTFPGTTTETFGTFNVVQILTGYAVSVTTSTGVVYEGYYHTELVNKGNNIVKEYKKLITPGLDQSTLTQTTPFYVSVGGQTLTGDSPFINSNTINASYAMSVSFTDYVMYKSNEGNYVPMGHFSWTVQATAAPNPNGLPKPYKVTTQRAGFTEEPTVDHNTWPGAWNFVTGDVELKKPT